MLSNLPDDWGMYYRKCEDCGGQYHMSEGGCGCYEERLEKLYEEVIERLQNATIDCTQHETASWTTTDELGDDLIKGSLLVRVYLDEKDGCDELIFSAGNWNDVKIAIGYNDPEDIE